MFALSARFRKSRTAGAPGSVCYIIRQDKNERNITGSIHGSDESVISEKKDRIAFDLMTIYCVIESMKSIGSSSLDDIAEQSRKALFVDNPYSDRISMYGDRYPICSDIASVGKLFNDRFDVKKAQDAGMSDSAGILSYTDRLAEEYDDAGKPYARSLRSGRRSLAAFLGDIDIPLSSLNAGFVSDYHQYLRSRVSMDTVSYYIGVLRNVINNARRDALIPSSFEWPANVRTGNFKSRESTGTHVLDIAVMCEIERLDLTDDPGLELTRDVFMFAFYAQGMELIDVANLKATNLSDNILTYNKRLKGSRQIVRLGEKAMGIISKYSDTGREYLFPLVERRWTLTFKTVSEEVARNLKAIGNRLNEPVKLTFTMNRYTWQSIMKTANIAEMLTR